MTAALALRARGLKVAVFEQAVELETGAGTSIHANAALLLQRVGLTDSIKKIGVPIAGLLLRTSAGKPIDTSAQPSSGFKHTMWHSRRLSETARGRATRRRTLSWSPFVSGERNRRPRATNVREWRHRRDGSRHWGRRHPFRPATRDRPENTSIERRNHGLQRPDPEQAVVVGKRHRRPNANVAREGPQFSALVSRLPPSFKTRRRKRVLLCPPTADISVGRQRCVANDAETGVCAAMMEEINATEGFGLAGSWVPRGKGGPG